jgi:hypothetical protein
MDSKSMCGWQESTCRGFVVFGWGHDVPHVAGHSGPADSRSCAMNESAIQTKANSLEPSTTRGVHSPVSAVQSVPTFSTSVGARTSSVTAPVFLGCVSPLPLYENWELFME